MKVIVFILATVHMVFSQAPTCNPACEGNESCRTVFDRYANTIKEKCVANAPIPHEGACSGLPLLQQFGALGTITQAFCGRGYGRIDCPGGFTCNIHPSDLFAVCCPESETCPYVEKDSFGACVIECESDSGCSEGKKCCPSACGGGTLCQTPCRPACRGTEKCMLTEVQCVTTPCLPQPTCKEPGVCPVPKKGTSCPASPTSTCDSDSDCAGGKKCCKNACDVFECKTPCSSECKPGYKCVEKSFRSWWRVVKKSMCVPITKPGTCPSAGPDEVGLCANMCQEDQDCNHIQKCCKTACGGTTCTRPCWPECGDGKSCVRKTGGWWFNRNRLICE